ncbi:MAG: helix-turn-helix domain-containing protein [Lysobacter sp.]
MLDFVFGDARHKPGLLQKTVNTQMRFIVACIFGIFQPAHPQEALTVSALLTWHLLTMDFGKRLAALRKQHAMTQQVLADAVGCHVTMIRRYEAGETQPTLDVIRNMARALSVSADALVFEQDERSPTEDLLLQFEAISQLPPEEQSIVKEVLDSLIIKYQTRRWDSARTAPIPAKKKAIKRAAPTRATR